MKFRLLFFFVFIAISGLLIGRSDMTQAMAASRDLEFMIVVEFLSEGKELPSAWNDIHGIQEMRMNIANQNKDKLLMLNNLALVPGAPLIRSEEGIQMNHQGYRLFAISRTTNFDEKSELNQSEGARYAVLVSMESSEVMSSRIPEPEARLILQQIDGFDPEKQPLAFEGLIQVSSDNSTSDSEFGESGENPSQHRKREITEEANQSEESNHLPWIFGILGTVAILAAVVVIFRKRKTS